MKLMCLPIIHRTWLKNIFRICAISECKRYLKKKKKDLSNSQILEFCKEYCFLSLVPKHEVEIYKWNTFSWMFRKHYLFQAWGPKISVQTPLAIGELYFSSILLVAKMKISECLGGDQKISFFSNVRFSIKSSSDQELDLRRRNQCGRKGGLPKWSLLTSTSGIHPQTERFSQITCWTLVEGFGELKG